MRTRQFSQDDHDAADDLELYLFNDGWIYEHLLQPVRRALLALIDGGTPYSRKRAAVRWQRVADAAAARYAREIGTATYDPRPRGARLLTADALADRFEADLKSGELDYLRAVRAPGGKRRAARPDLAAAVMKLVR